jgi:hypothetical protein
MSGYEDGDLWPIAAQQLKHVESIVLGHLHVEEHEVGPRAANLRDRLGTRTALLHGRDVRVSAQQNREVATRERLVIDDQRAQSYRLALRRHASGFREWE